MEDISVALALIAILGFVAFWGWLRFRRESAQSQLLFEAQKHLLDKLGSTAEVSQFLSSAEGKELLDRLKPPPAPSKPKPPSPAEVMFMMIWSALVLIGVGAGFFVGAIWVSSKLILPAAIIAFAGVAILIGLMITHALAGRWGLFKRVDGRLVPPDYRPTIPEAHDELAIFCERVVSALQRETAGVTDGARSQHTRGRSHIQDSL